jgi:hypothetical protein
LKKFAVVGIAVAALTLSGCGASSGFEGSNNYDYGGYSSNGGYTDHDWDMNYGSSYNNNTYCQGGTYNPMPNNQYSCNRNGVTSAPVVRPPVVIPPKSAQKAPADVLKKVEQQKAEVQRKADEKKKADQATYDKKQQQQQKAPAQQAPKAPPAAPKAPAAKTGK